MPRLYIKCEGNTEYLSDAKSEKGSTGVQEHGMYLNRLDEGTQETLTEVERIQSVRSRIQIQDNTHSPQGSQIAS